MLWPPHQHLTRLEMRCRPMDIGVQRMPAAGCVCGDFASPLSEIVEAQVCTADHTCCELRLRRGALLMWSAARVTISDVAAVSDTPRLLSCPLLTILCTIEYLGTGTPATPSCAYWTRIRPVLGKARCELKKRPARSAASWDARNAPPSSKH